MAAEEREKFQSDQVFNEVSDEVNCVSCIDAVSFVGDTRIQSTE